MSIVRLAGLLIFAAITTASIAILTGGKAFISQPLGQVFLALWVAWWVAIALGRQRGRPSSYDRSQRGIFALGILALVSLVILVPWEYSTFDGPLPRNGLLAWIGAALFGASILLQATAFRSLRGMYTTRLGIQEGHRLVTIGLYRWLRHPGYLSNILSLGGIGLALSSLIGLGVTLLVIPLILVRIQKEEAMLLVEFGDVYRAYQQRTRRLIPGVY
jgi:protein-S-isoprenylcysteine O-methyltransferase Ste14